MGNLTGQSTLVTGYCSAQVNGVVYLTNGLDRVKRFDGENWYDAGIAKETFTPTIGSSGSGTFTGTWNYLFTFINKTLPLQLNRYPESLPVGPFSVTATSKAQLDISVLPGTHADSQVTHVRVYRSKDGGYDAGTSTDKQAFFYVADVPIATTTYTDTTIDDSLSSTFVSFKTNIPVPGRYVEFYGNRLWFAGNDPLTTGTATVNATPTLIDFSGVTIPSGVVGAFFQADGDDARYEITAHNSTTQITLASAYVGSLSGANYSIWRERNTLWPSQQFNPEAYGPAGEGFRNYIEIGPRSGDDEITGLRSFGGMLLVFMAKSVWAVSGNGTSLVSYQASDSPLWTQYGSVSKASGRSQFAEADGVLYWMSPFGPCRWSGQGAPELFGQRLGKNFMETLSGAYLSKICVGYAPISREIRYSVPLGSATENDTVYAFSLDTGEWYKDDGMWIAYYFNADDANGITRLFSCQNDTIWEEDTGTDDGTAGTTKSGTATGGSTTTLVDSGATFYTTGAGLHERVCWIFDSDGNYKAKGRIDSNTSTTLTFASAITTVVSGDTYYIGSIYAYWKSRVYRQPTTTSKSADLEIELELQGESPATKLWQTTYVDGTKRGNPQPVLADDPTKLLPIDEHGKDFQYRMEWREVGSQIAIRSINIEEQDIGKTHG